MDNGLPFVDLTLESSGWVDPGDEDNQLVFSDLVATEDPVLQTQRPTITASPNQRITVRAVSARSWKPIGGPGDAGGLEETLCALGGVPVAEIPVVDVR